MQGVGLLILVLKYFPPYGSGKYATKFQKISATKIPRLSGFKSLFLSAWITEKFDNLFGIVSIKGKKVKVLLA